jgi:hypothetical protein
MSVPLHVNLRNRVVVVTGGGGILCSVMAKALAECGVEVAILDSKAGGILAIQKAKAKLLLPERLYRQLAQWKMCVREVSGITAGMCAVVYDVAKIFSILLFCILACKCLIDGKFSAWLAAMPAIQAMDLIRSLFKNRCRNS